MTRLRKKTSIVSLTVLVMATTGMALAKPLAASLSMNASLIQSLGTLTFPLPTTVPVGTAIRIGGSSSMETINQVLKQRFEQQFVGTEVQLNTQGTGPAIKDLLDGNADLAAIGRSLTEQEKAQGLVAVPVSRHKIAIIVGSENPFKDDLTFEQFAKIFRGEIKDWAQIGGEPGPIRFIDRPDNSDTRQAFRNYPVFKQAPFVTGKTAKQLAEDSTSQVVQALRTDGIGYAIADQLQGRGDVRVISLNNALPSNPKYPFSQPLVYVYKGPQPNPSAQAFLGFAAAPASRQTIETARKEASAALVTNTDPTPPPTVTVPSPPTVSPSATQAAAPSAASVNPEVATNNPLPWWVWLLGLPLLGSLFWWVLHRREVPFESDDPMPLPTDVPAPLPSAIAPHTTTIAPHTTAIAPEPSYESPSELRSVSLDDAVKVGGAALAGGTVLAGDRALENDPTSPSTSPPIGQSQVFLVPRDAQNAYVHWNVTQADKDALKHQGGQQLVLRVYEMTHPGSVTATAHSVQQFLCNEWDQDQQVPIPVSNLDYVAELGYIALDGRFLTLARSPQTRISGS